MMPDNGTITAMIVTVASALTAVGGAVKGIADVKSTKDLVELIGGEDGKGGLIGKLTKRIEEVAALLDPAVRADLDETIAKVEELIAKVARYRSEARAAATARGQSVQATGSVPSIDSLQTMSQRLEDFERRLTEAEAKAQRNEDKITRTDETFVNARIAIEVINSQLRTLLGRPPQ